MAVSEWVFPVLQNTCSADIAFDLEVCLPQWFPLVRAFALFCNSIFKQASSRVFFLCLLSPDLKKKRSCQRTDGVPVCLRSDWRAASFSFLEMFPRKRRRRRRSPHEYSYGALSPSAPADQYSAALIDYRVVAACVFRECLLVGSVSGCRCHPAYFTTELTLFTPPTPQPPD